MQERAIDKLLAAQEVRLAKAWLEAVEWLREQNPVETIGYRLANNAAEPVIMVEEYATLVANALTAAQLAGYHGEDGWLRDELAKLQKRTIADALADFEAERLTRIREITEEQRSVISRIVAEGRAANQSSSVIARDLRGSLGLTDAQERHVANYRRALETGDFDDALGRELRDGRADRMLRAARERGAALDAKRIDALVERYRTNYIEHRQSVIARTESLRGVHAGAQARLEAAVAAGELDGARLVREWHATMSPRTRDSHAVMNGQQRGVEERFRTGRGYRLLYPGDPSAPAKETIHCRCSVSTRLVPADSATVEPVTESDTEAA